MTRSPNWQATFAVALLGVTWNIGLSASNIVPATRAEEHVVAITAETLKPPECAGITLTAIVTGSGTITGTAAAELVVGSANVDNVSAGAGADCILGGAGGDVLQGQGSGDVLIGHGGNDTLDGGAGTDVCYGGAELDTFLGCETENQ